MNLKKSHEDKTVFNFSFVHHILMVYILFIVICLTPLGYILFFLLLQNFNQHYISYFYLEVCSRDSSSHYYYSTWRICSVLGCKRHLDRCHIFTEIICTFGFPWTWCLSIVLIMWFKIFFVQTLQVTSQNCIFVDL